MKKFEKASLIKNRKRGRLKNSRLREWEIWIKI